MDDTISAKFMALLQGLMARDAQAAPASQMRGGVSGAMPQRLAARPPTPPHAIGVRG